MSNDNWQTPQWLFDELNKEFNFTVDLCATETNKKCYHWVGETEDGGLLSLMATLLGDHVCWMNPPYSDPFPFVAKAWEISQYNKVVCLLKVDTSTKWWAIFWDYAKHKPKDGCEIRFFSKRIKFTPPLNTNGKNGPTFPTCVVIMDRRNEQ